MRVLIVPDKFKGTLTAQQAAKAIQAGWVAVRPQDIFDIVLMSDGGDGFGEVMASLLGAETLQVDTLNAAHQPVRARWWWDPRTKTAIVESAEVIGLAMLPPAQFHPFDLDTFGLGALFREAKELGARTCICGIGGSATNDAGFGLARALGYEFRDAAGRGIQAWTAVNELHTIISPSQKTRFENLTIAVDVQNPLLGPTGATRIYGPQKGMRPQDFATADKAFDQLVCCVEKTFGTSPHEEPGTGAAGGLGYGLRVFLNGEFEAGFSIFAKYAQLEQRISEADLVITGEGSIDSQSLMGKGTGAVAQLCQKKQRKCVGLAGRLEESALPDLKTLFYDVRSIVPGLTSAEQAKAGAARWLEALASVAARGA